MYRGERQIKFIFICIITNTNEQDSKVKFDQTVADSSCNYVFISAHLVPFIVEGGEWSVSDSLHIGLARAQIVSGIGSRSSVAGDLVVSRDGSFRTLCLFKNNSKSWQESNGITHIYVGSTRTGPHPQCPCELQDIAPFAQVLGWSLTIKHEVLILSHQPTTLARIT